MVVFLVCLTYRWSIQAIVLKFYCKLCVACAVDMRSPMLLIGQCATTILTSASSFPERAALERPVRQTSAILSNVSFLGRNERMRTWLNIRVFLEDLL